MGEGLPSYLVLMVDIGFATEQKLYAAAMPPLARVVKRRQTPLDAKGVAQTMSE